MFDFYTLHSVASNVSDTHSRASETEKELKIEIDLPGVRRTDVSVIAADRFVTVRATRGTRKLSRTLELPQNYDTETIAAHLEDGVLTLTAQRKATKLSREIVVT